MKDGALTLRDAAAHLGISRTSMWRLVTRGFIRCYDYPVGGLRVDLSDLNAFQQSCERASAARAVALPKLRPARTVDESFTFRMKAAAQAKVGRQ